MRRLYHRRAALGFAFATLALLLAFTFAQGQRPIKRHMDDLPFLTSTPTAHFFPTGWWATLTPEKP